MRRAGASDAAICSCMGGENWFGTRAPLRESFLRG